jgi:hypothetical protein
MKAKYWLSLCIETLEDWASSILAEGSECFAIAESDMQLICLNLSDSFWNYV